MSPAHLHSIWFDAEKRFYSHNFNWTRSSIVNLRAKSCNERVSVVDKSTRHSSPLYRHIFSTTWICVLQSYCCFVRCMLWHSCGNARCTHYVVLSACLCCWLAVFHSLRFAAIVRDGDESIADIEICDRCTICTTQWMAFENSIWCLCAGFGDMFIFHVKRETGFGGT